MAESHLAVRTFVVLDVARFSARDRDDHDRRIIRDTLRAAVDRAFADSHMDRGGVPAKDTGDGMILLLPDRVTLPDRILHPWLANLATELAHANRGTSEVTRIRLRVAVHHGYLNVDSKDGDGTSADLILACRLVDAEELKAAVAGERGAPLALIVSDAVYQGVVRHHPRGVDPATYRRVSVAVKETTADAWICVPGGDRRERDDRPSRPARSRPSTPPAPPEPAAPPASLRGAASHTFNAPITVNGGDFVGGDKFEHRHPDSGRSGR